MQQKSKYGSSDLDLNKLIKQNPVVLVELPEV